MRYIINLIIKAFIFDNKSEIFITKNINNLKIAIKL